MVKKTPIKMGKRRRMVVKWVRKHAGRKFLMDELVEGIGLDPENHKDRTSTYNALRGIREAILKKYLLYTLEEPELLKYAANEEKFYDKVIEYIRSFGLYLLICDDEHYYFEPTFDELNEYQNKRILQEWNVFYNRVQRSATLRAELPSGKRPKALLKAVEGIDKGYLLPGATETEPTVSDFVPCSCPSCRSGLLVSIDDEICGCTDCFEKFKKADLT